MPGRLRLVWIGLGIAIAYLVWVAVSRYIGGPAVPVRTRPADIAAYPGAEGTALKVLSFYADRSEVTKGESVTICYGVANARSVRIEPAVAQLEPALNRCFSVAPQRSTSFALTAQGDRGNTAAAAFTIKVNPAPPRILFVALSTKELKRGELFTMCYGVTNSSSVAFAPMGWNLEASAKNCRMWYPVRTMKYTLTAASPDGRTDTETFTVRVK